MNHTSRGNLAIGLWCLFSEPLYNRQAQVEMTENYGQATVRETVGSSSGPRLVD